MSKYWNDDGGAAYRSLIAERDQRVRDLRHQARVLSAAARSALDDVIRLERLLRQKEWHLTQAVAIKTALRLCRLEAEITQRDAAARYRHARLLMGMRE
jgi:hypothetical protein